MAARSGEASPSKRRDVGRAVGAERHRADRLFPVADSLQIRVDGLAVVRVDAPRDEHAFAPREALGHEHRFGGGARAVVHRRIGDGQAEDLAHDRLKLEDRPAACPARPRADTACRPCRTRCAGEADRPRAIAVVVGAGAEKDTQLGAPVLLRELDRGAA